MADFVDSASDEKKNLSDELDTMEIPDEDEEEEQSSAMIEPGNQSKKKKKRKKNKKNSSISVATLTLSEQRPLSRLLGGQTNYFVKYGQSFPPTRPLADLFPNGSFPCGQILPHGKTKYPDPNSSYVRTTDAERKEKERALHPELYDKVRHASEVHRQVRSFAQSFIEPGIKLADMCEKIEDCNRRLVQEKGLQAGIAFPTGCSINNVAAHYSPNPGDNTVLQYGDVMKIDFGTQIEGRIIDCAWSVAFDPTFDELLMAVKEATNTGIKAAGIDVQLCEIGEQIEEVMQSHEVTINNVTYPIKCCRNLNGHSINPYQIHGGKSVPIVKNTDTTRMEEGEFYAIETFGSTGRGWVIEHGDCSHYMRDFQARPRPLKSVKAKKLFWHINKTFGTLAFCKRWLSRDDGGSYTVNGLTGRQEQYDSALRTLVDEGLINPYPPLVDVPGSYVAQYEHTLLLRPTCKEVLSRGDDY